ncbi:MAG: SDR family NAD(P)-dependent oxidoreductase [Calditrichaeota bacterium]|nr:MAG: SDR family NAD(P)-dependent oxidoreductase [Calditrichota bacterium]
MDLGIKKKHAYVAASSRGLGFAAALELAREGAQVSICGRNLKTITAAAKEITRLTKADVLPIVTDISTAEEIEKSVAAARENFGPIEILVNNAGGPPAGLFDDIGEDGWQRGFELTLMSAVRLIHAVLPGMKKRSWGRIVNITSISVKQPIQGLFLSNALRPGIIGMAKSLAEEVAGLGITINNVCPGWTETERVNEILQARIESSGKTMDEEMRLATESIPMGRMGKPAELAAMIAFLCSERASYITGVSVPVDGGSFKGLM